jgi:cell division protein FtsW
MGLLPTKGLTLPFLSYGGSSLVVLCFMFGLLLSIENAIENDPLSVRLAQLRAKKH